MCGIVYAKNLKNAIPVNGMVKLMFHNQRDRGTEGFGFVGLSADRLDVYRETKADNILRQLNHCYYDEILLHHRLPTSTRNTLRQTHPFVIHYEHEKYYFIHNGIIANAKKLHAKHRKQGIHYRTLTSDGSFNDSEALAWDFVLSAHSGFRELEVMGSLAFICLETDKQTNYAKRLYFFRDAFMPLHCFYDDHHLLLSSEGQWGKLIKDNQLFYYDYQSRKIDVGKALLADGYWYNPLSYYDYSEIYDEWDKKMVRQQIRELEMEKDYLLSRGKVEEANELDEEIEMLAVDYS